MASWIVRMITISVISTSFIYTPIISFRPCFPPLITYKLYDCYAPGPGLPQDYLQIILLAGINVVIVWQSILDAIVHGCYIALLCCILLTEYVLINRYVNLIYFINLIEFKIETRFGFFHMIGNERHRKERNAALQIHPNFGERSKHKLEVHSNTWSNLLCLGSRNLSLLWNYRI